MQKISKGLSTRLLARGAVASAVWVTLSAGASNAATFVYTGTGGTDNWSTGTNWSPGVPVSAADTTLVFGNGTSLAASAAVVSNNDLPGTFQLNRLAVNYAGPATGTAPTVTISGNPLEFVNNGGIAPTLMVANTGTVVPSVTISNGIVLTNNTTVNATTGFRLSGGLSGGGNLTKTGVGILTLSNVVSSNTGATTVLEGTLSPNFDIVNGPTTNLINPASALTLGGTASLSASSPATLSVQGRNSNGVVNTQTFAGTTLNAGRSAVTATRGGVSTNTLAVNLGAITRNEGATTAFTPNVNTTINTTNGNVNGILGGWATSGLSFATVNASGNIVALPAASYTITPGATTGSQVVASNAASNARLTDNANAGSTAEIGSTTIAVTPANLANFAVGDAVAGTFTVTTGNAGTLSIPAGTTVTAIDTTANTITLSNAVVRATGTAGAASSNTANVLSSRGASLAAGGVTDVNTLQITSETARTLDIGAGNTLRLGSQGAIWRAVAAGIGTTVNITGGSITAGGADNTAGELVLRTDGTGGNTTVFNVIGSNLVNNGTGALTVVKDGTQALQLTGANTYTGNTYVNLGVLQATQSNGFGSGDVIVAGGSGAQAFASGATYDNDFFINGIGAGTSGGGVAANIGALRLGTGTTATNINGVVTLVGDARIGGGTTTVFGNLNGKITGPGALTVGGGTANAAGFLVLSSTANDYNGDTIVLATGTTGSGSILRLGASEVIPDGAGKGNLVLASSPRFVSVQLNGFNETVNGLSTANSFNTELSGTTGGASIRNNSTTTASVLTVGNNNAGGNFRGQLVNGATATLGLTKIGTGTQILSGISTYTGPTLVQGGTLEVNNAGGTNLTVETAGRLGGATPITLGGGQLSLSGTALRIDGTTANNDRLNNASAVNFAGGTLNLNGLSEGAAGTNGVGTLTLSADSFLNFGAGASVIQFAGFTDAGGSLSLLNWSGTPETGGGTDQLLFAGDAAVVLDGASADAFVFTGFGGYSVVQSAGYFEVVASTVPEPTAALALAGGLALLTRRRPR